MQDQLAAFLDFYRENRALLTTILHTSANSPSTAPEQEQEKRPQEDPADALNVIESFLKRSGV